MGRAELLALHGIGPRTTDWLLKVGITSYDDIDRLGAVAAYRLLLDAGYPATLNALYALESVLLECHWRDLPGARKAELVSELRGG
jgi:TfoX/Sxy family transcriptional regulator of competence genes